MINLPFFSVIVPTYNRLRLLQETIATLYGQSYTDFEVIVIDNASSDGTHEYGNTLSTDKRFTYVRSEINMERAWSRNRGLQLARGRYVTFLDSDDFMYTNCLADAYDFAQANPRCLIFHNLYELVDSERRVVHRFTFPRLGNQFKALASGNFLSCIGGFLHQSVYPSVRFNADPRMIGAEDYEVWFEVLAKHRLGRINRVNSGIREHTQRSVHQGVYDNLAYQEEQLIQKVKESPLLYEKFGPWLSRLRANFLFHRAVVAKGLGQSSIGWGHFAAALVNDPSCALTRRAYSVAYNLISRP